MHVSLTSKRRHQRIRRFSLTYFLMKTYTTSSSSFFLLLDFLRVCCLKTSNMVTIVSHISDYFEQFNSSIHSSAQSVDVPSSMDTMPLSFYVFDFERYSDQMATLHDLRTFMVQRWHNSFFYALAYLFLIYSKRKIPWYPVCILLSSGTNCHEK